MNVDPSGNISFPSLSTTMGSIGVLAARVGGVASRALARAYVTAGRIAVNTEKILFYAEVPPFQ
jgi:hypothetical protein